MADLGDDDVEKDVIVEGEIRVNVGKKSPDPTTARQKGISCPSTRPSGGTPGAHTNKHAAFSPSVAAQFPPPPKKKKKKKKKKKNVLYSY